MSRPRGRRAALGAATLLTTSVLALGLAGCSAGSITQTDTALSGATGSFGGNDRMLIRNLAIDAGPTQVVPAAPQSTAALEGTLVNEAGTADRLLSVTTPYAQTVTLEGATTVPGDNAVRLVSQPGPLPAVQPDVRESSTARITLRGITQNLRPGPTYTLTLNFQQAGPITVPLVVRSAGEAAG